MTDLVSLDAVVTAEHARSPFSGVVSVARPGEVLVSRAFGLADRANGRPNTVDTRFGIASGCKVFTAVAIADLVDAGRLAFDAPLNDVVTEDLTGLDPRITVADLLTHSAGNPDYFDEEVMDDYGALWRDRPTYAVRRPADFLPMFVGQPAKFAPGDRFSYNNAGFVLLGLVIESVSGTSFTEYVTSRVLERAGMADSGYFALDELPARTATGYLDSSSLRSNVFSVPAVGGPDGGAWTTVADLDRFWRALLGRELLSPATTEAVLTRRVGSDPDDPDAGYGYGVWISGTAVDPTYYVVGEDPGVSMVSAVTPSTGIVHSVLANTDDGAWAMNGVIDAALKG